MILVNIEKGTSHSCIRFFKRSLYFSDYTKYDCTVIASICDCDNLKNKYTSANSTEQMTVQMNTK